MKSANRATSSTLIARLIQREELIQAARAKTFEIERDELEAQLAKLLHERLAHGRLAEALLYFADNIFRSDEYEMVLSRQELGEMTNMAKESVVRILKEFSDSGIIEYNSSSIKIIDKQKLNLILKKG
jgi:CRP/FNR family transcriptional regulator